MAELLSVPLKKSSDVDIIKPLKNLLHSTYSSSETHEDYSDAINELSRLRSAAIWKVFEKSSASVDILYSYYDQLCGLESKVPPHEVQIPFKWKDAFDKGSIFGGRMSLTISSLSYERVCVLFNIGALQSATAAAQPLDTEDELKLAAKLLQQAAGVFAALRGGALAALAQDPTPDLAPDTLDALAKLMLAQAQEVVAYKCMRDEMKDSMVAKVCAAAEEMFTDAARALGKEALRPLWERDWLPAVAAKQQLFRGLAQLAQAGDCRARAAVGEELARLRLAEEQLRAAAERLPPGRAATRAADHAARAARRRAAALKDNDFIYHEREPDAAALEPLARAPVAKPLPPPARYGAAPDLFAALVPAAERAAAAAAAAAAEEAAAADVARLRDGTRALNAALAALNLPAALEERGGALPESIRARAEAVRAAGGAPALRRLMAELPELLRRNTDILDEAARLLREEAEVDAALRERFGPRWARTPSAALTAAFRQSGDKYRQIIDNAVRADDIVRDKFEAHLELIELLGGGAAAVEARVPAGGGGVEAARAPALRALLARVDALKAERDALEAALLAARADTGGLRARADASLAAQDELCAALRAAAGADAGADERARLLAALAGAHDAYQELTANLTEGTKFYNDLTQLLVAYQNKVSDYCFARKTEKEELLKDLTQEASRAPATPAPAPAAPAPAPVTPAAPAALPYPAQPQGMPMPFGAGAASYYAPLPALYNPYATLPYPHHVRAPPYAPYQHPPQPAAYPAPPAPGYAPPAPGYSPYPPPPQ